MLKRLTYTRLISLTFLGLTFIVFAFPVLSFALRSISMIVWAFFGVLVFKNSSDIDKKGIRDFFVLTSPYLVLILTVFYSNDFESATRRIIQMAPFFIAPLIFFLNKGFFNQFKVNRIFYVFSCSVFLFVSIQIGYSIFNIDYITADLSDNEIIRNLLSESDINNPDKVNVVKGRRFRNFLLDNFKTHFTYQGLWIVLSVFFLTLRGLKCYKTYKIKAVAYFFISGIMIAWALIISSRISIIALIIATYVIILVSEKYSFKIKMGFLLGSIVFIGLSYCFITPFKVRIQELINYSFDLPKNEKGKYTFNSVNVRNGIYFCSYEIFRNNYFVGVGVGDVQIMLNNCYNNKLDADVFLWNSYNTHNQYLLYLLSTGILGVLIFIHSIYFQIKTSIKNRKYVYLFLIITISVFFLTENVLSRSDGIMFYSLFMGLLYFNDKQ